MRHRSKWTKKAAIVMVLRDWQPKDVSDHLGMNRAYISTVLSGRIVSQEIITKISKLLGISDTDSLSDLPEIVIRELNKKDHGE